MSAPTSKLLPITLSGFIGRRMQLFKGRATLPRQRFLNASSFISAAGEDQIVYLPPANQDLIFLETEDLPSITFSFRFLSASGLVRKLLALNCPWLLNSPKSLAEHRNGNDLAAVMSALEPLRSFLPPNKSFVKMPFEYSSAYDETHLTLSQVIAHSTYAGWLRIADNKIQPASLADFMTLAESAKRHHYFFASWLKYGLNGFQMGRALSHRLPWPITVFGLGFLWAPLISTLSSLTVGFRRDARIFTDICQNYRQYYQDFLAAPPEWQVSPDTKSN